MKEGKYTKIYHQEEELHDSSGGYYTRVVNKGTLDQVRYNRIMRRLK